MGVDFYTCSNCRATYPDCGPTWRCVNEHGLGPCCMDDRKEYPEDDDGAVMAEACPCCAKGGTELERTKAERDRLAAECERMRKALEEAEQSLRTISILAGTEDLETILEIRGYANSRALVARKVLTPPSQGEKT